MTLLYALKSAKHKSKGATIGSGRPLKPKFNDTNSLTGKNDENETPKSGGVMSYCIAHSEMGRKKKNLAPLPSWYYAGETIGRIKNQYFPEYILYNLSPTNSLGIRRPQNISGCANVHNRAQAPSFSITILISKITDRASRSRQGICCVLGGAL